MLQYRKSQPKGIRVKTNYELLISQIVRLNKFRRRALNIAPVVLPKRELTKDAQSFANVGESKIVSLE
jgi:hypothetical protein